MLAEWDQASYQAGYQAGALVMQLAIATATLLGLAVLLISGWIQRRRKRP